MPFDLSLRAASILGPPFLLALEKTWRYRQIDAGGQPVGERYRAGAAIHALWHAQQLPLTLRHRTENIAVIVSRHRDGEIISRVVERIGYRTIRGSSTRGGSEALREFTSAAFEGYSLAITTDGPQGPRRQCKPGAILAAARAGLPIVPVGAAAVRAWTFDSWDRFFVPRPGSVVVISYGPPLAVPPDLGRLPVSEWQLRLTKAQNEATEACEEAAAKIRSGH
ncbi:MAG: lysophospholipid acyltransferase family protein [marine benthic group bacterium]|nr:lysophospholipid acyltransferase family protein [Candidatus Benthicola marisminoris]